MENGKENGEHHDCCMKKNESSQGMQKYLLLVMVGAVLMLSIVQSFQIISLKDSKGTTSLVSAAVSAGQIDMAGWTEDEKMMYEHHGVMPSGLQPGKSQSSGMVGGC